MSGIAAILHPGDVATRRAALDRLISASASRGPHGHFSWLPDEPVALGYLSFETMCETEPQPLVDSTRRLAIVFDGRLDNRDDLAAALHVPVLNRVEPWSDSRLVLEAVARWDVEAPKHLLGDFAWIAWDGARRRLLAARDHLGLRPLHYCARPDAFLCASDVAQLLAADSTPREPDLDVVAAYLAYERANDERTLLRGISRVPPGHALVVEGSRVVLHQYWRPEPAAPLRLRDDQEYAAACRELLVRSVACRTRARRPVAAMLSGGIDSSAVVTAARRVGNGGHALRAFSMIFPEIAEADERAYISDVVAHTGVESIAVRPSGVTAETMRRYTARILDYPPFAADFAAITLYDTIREHGHDVVLTGAGGDFVFSGSFFHYADLLREGRVATLVRQYLADRRSGATSMSPAGLLQRSVWPLLPRGVKHALRPFARRMSGHTDRPSWLRLPYARPTVPHEPWGGSVALEEIQRHLFGGLHALFLEAGERMLAAVPLESRDPLLDIRLIEFALAVPEQQRRRGPIGKFVLRNALGADLAPSVARRRTKGAFGHLVADALEALGGARFYSSLGIADAGWVDGAAAASLYRQMRDSRQRGDARFGDDVPALWGIAAMELWFDAVVGK